MHRWAGVLVVIRGGKLVLQQRDNKPGITHPGKVTLFGGSLEENEEPLGAALRELDEELGLKVRDNSLKRLITYYKERQFDGEDSESNVFYLTEVSPENLFLREGAAILEFDPRKDELDGFSMSTVTRLSILAYLEKTKNV